VAAACVQVALVEVGCGQAVWVVAVRCAQVALTGGRSWETVWGTLGLSREFRIRSQTDPTLAGLAGQTWVYRAGPATGPAGAGAADGAAITGVGVGVQRPWERVWRIQQPTQITVTPMPHPMAIAITDMVRTDMVRTRPHTVILRPHMGPTPSRIVLGASARTIRQARRIFRTAANGFRAHSGRAKVDT